MPQELPPSGGAGGQGRLAVTTGREGPRRDLAGICFACAQPGGGEGAIWGFVPSPGPGWDRGDTETPSWARAGVCLRPGFGSPLGTCGAQTFCNSLLGNGAFLRPPSPGSTLDARHSGDVPRAPPAIPPRQQEPHTGDKPATSFIAGRPPPSHGGHGFPKSQPRGEGGQHPAPPRGPPVPMLGGFTPHHGVTVPPGLGVTPLPPSQLHGTAHTGGHTHAPVTATRVPWGVAPASRGCVLGCRVRMCSGCLCWAQRVVEVLPEVEA